MSRVQGTGVSNQKAINSARVTQLVNSFGQLGISKTQLNEDKDLLSGNVAPDKFRAVEYAVDTLIKWKSKLKFCNISVEVDYSYCNGYIYSKSDVETHKLKMRLFILKGINRLDTGNAFNLKLPCISNVKNRVDMICSKKFLEDAEGLINTNKLNTLDISKMSNIGYCERDLDTLLDILSADTISDIKNMGKPKTSSKTPILVYDNHKLKATIRNYLEIDDEEFAYPQRIRMRNYSTSKRFSLLISSLRKYKSYYEIKKWLPKSSKDDDTQTNRDIFDNTDIDIILSGVTEDAHEWERLEQRLSTLESDGHLLTEDVYQYEKVKEFVTNICNKILDAQYGILDPKEPVYPGMPLVNFRTKTIEFINDAIDNLVCDLDDRNSYLSSSPEPLEEEEFDVDAYDDYDDDTYYLNDEFNHNYHTY